MTVMPSVSAAPRTWTRTRLFTPGPLPEPIVFRGTMIGVPICEDIWNDEDFWPERRYQHNPPVELAEHGAQYHPFRMGILLSAHVGETDAQAEEELARLLGRLQGGLMRSES